MLKLVSLDLIDTEKGIHSRKYTPWELIGTCTSKTRWERNQWQRNTPLW